ncbi:MAG: penicillin-binding protein activator [Proteobacteria bacterium]|nr:penicillin-binding protein activator [Pseudomonadota bacterium]
MVIRSALISTLLPLRFVLVGVAALITCACTSQGNVQEQTPAPAPDPLAAAERLLNRGDYAGAAAAFAVQAPQLSGAEAAHANALASLAYQDAGDAAQAATALTALSAGGESSAPLAMLAQARAQLEGGHADVALALASKVQSASLSPYARGVQSRVIAAAAASLADFPTAAAAGIQSLQYPYPPAQQAALTQATWAAVSQLPAARLTEQLAATAAEPVANGWYALAAINQQSAFDAEGMRQKLAEWQQRHAGHVATPLLDGLLERATAAGARPTRVALVLPFDETLGGAARAVRDGFMTAWFNDTNTTARPAVSVYANSGDDILKDYQRAVSDGAEFIVGPLQKNLVERLKTLPEMPVGVLALNVVENKPGAVGARPGFYQFGLTPEDEASQVARRAYSEGGRALIIAPNSAWGARLSGAYNKAWQDLGGSVLAQISYSDSADAYPSAVRRALNIDMSEARAAALRRKLGMPLHSEARIRADVSAILLAAFPNNARQLLPQLRYFGADSIPVYATSTVFNGNTRTNDVDLNGLVFGDMPWLFGTVDADSYQLVRRSWPGPAQTYTRLYGFGIDAYRILPFLSRMRARPTMRVPGVTGDLWMDGDGVLHRNMSWIKFVDGVPRAIGETGTVGVN